MSPLYVYVLNLILVFVLVFANAFFVVSEFAIVKIRRTKLEELAHFGNKRAKIALKITENLNTYLSAIQLGITLASLGLGWIGEPAVASLLEELLGGYFAENKRGFHNFGNNLVKNMINRLFHGDIHDIMTGYRAFSFTFAKTYPVLSRGFEVETEMTIHSLNNNLRLYEMPIQYRDRPEGSVSKLDTVGDGIKVMSTIFRMIREYKPLPFFGGFGLLLGIIGLILTISVGIDFIHTGIVARFPTLIGAVMLIIAGLLLIVTGIILDVIAKNDRKTFVIDTNRFAFLKRHTK